VDGISARPGGSLHPEVGQLRLCRKYYARGTCTNESRSSGGDPRVSRAERGSSSPLSSAGGKLRYVCGMDSGGCAGVVKTREF